MNIFPGFVVLKNVHGPCYGPEVEQVFYRYGAGSGLRHKAAPQLLLGEPPVSFLSDSTPNVRISQGSLNLWSN